MPHAYCIKYFLIYFPNFLNIFLPNNIYLVLGDESTDGLLVTKYTNLNHLMTAIFTLGSLQLVAAALACVVANKVRELRHYSYHTSVY